MKSIQKLNWQSPNYFPLKDALIKSGTAYFEGVEGNKCLVTPGYTGNTTPTSIVPVTNTEFKYTDGPANSSLCGVVKTNSTSKLCESFTSFSPCIFGVQVNYDISINVCSACF